MKKLPINVGVIGCNNRDGIRLYTMHTITVDIRAGIIGNSVFDAECFV